jgi:putative CocE/NonD family hydrolase
VSAGIDYGADAVIDLNGYVARWFDHFLKGIDNGVIDDPPVYVFVMGPNRWYGEEDWPLPQTQWTQYYLGSGGHANSLKGDGVLSTRAPREEGVDTYVYDPADPTPSPYGDHGHIPGAVDARLPAIGDDVLVYQTPPLSEPVEVTGPIEAKLYAATSARDTDWMVRLVDVHPDGYAALLTEGLMRARNRDPEDEGRFRSDRLSTIEPNEVYEYTIQFWRGTGNVFDVGHRIRVEISSSYYPYYLRNLNSGADNVGLVTEDEAVVATQKIYHGGPHPSYIVLPIIERM